MYVVYGSFLHLPRWIGFPMRAAGGFFASYRWLASAQMPRWTPVAGPRVKDAGASLPFWHPSSPQEGGSLEMVPGSSSFLNSIPHRRHLLRGLGDAWATAAEGHHLSRLSDSRTGSALRSSDCAGSLWVYHCRRFPCGASPAPTNGTRRHQSRPGANRARSSPSESP